MGQLTDEQNEILLELFDTVHDSMHMMRLMAQSMEEAVVETEHCLLMALRALNAEDELFRKPTICSENVIQFPEGGRNE